MKTSWEDHQSWPFYNYMRSCIVLKANHSTVIQHWKGKEARYVGASRADWRIKIILKCHLLLFWTTKMIHFPMEFWCVMKSGFIQQPGTTSSVFGLRRSSQALPKAKLAPKKYHGQCLVICFLSDPLQLCESQWNHSIWEVCSANRWHELKTAMPAAGIGQKKGPSSSQQCLTAHCSTNASKVEWTGLRNFASSTIFMWLPSIFTTFCRESISKTSRRQKMLSKSSSSPKAQNFYTTGIHKLVSHCQNCVDCKGSYFD